MLHVCMVFLSLVGSLFIFSSFFTLYKLCICNISTCSVESDSDVIHVITAVEPAAGNVMMYVRKSLFSSS